MEERDSLKEQLKTVDQSLFYLTLIVASVLLSFRSVLIQREQLEDLLAGNPERAAAREVFPIKLTASALVVGGLAFFFRLSLRTCREAAQGEDPAARRSAGMNVWASLFVLLAALIRLCDLDFTRAAAGEETQPEQAGGGAAPRLTPWAGCSGPFLPRCWCPKNPGRRQSGRTGTPGRSSPPC